VLEAKLAMMLRIAQTETGGRKLIQAGLLKTLGSCDFISRQPYLEDMDCKCFLTIAVELELTARPTRLGKCASTAGGTISSSITTGPASRWSRGSELGFGNRKGGATAQRMLRVF
jgi:hypothetical protein